MKTVKIGNIQISNTLPLALIAGPCVIESEYHVMMMAEQLTKITEKINIPFIFKSSFDKANRTSIKSARGVKIDEAVKIFEKIKKSFNCLVLTDIHETYQVDILNDVIDVFQIPALLCRQTDLLLTAGKTGKPINVKKGQFLSPYDMKNVADKILSTGNDNVMLCERGTFFGYNKLVNDMTGLSIMQKTTGLPVIFDATHSVQEPGGLGTCSGGKREFVELLARAAVATGIAGVFFETHDNPDVALSDGPNMIFLDKMEDILRKLQQIDSLVKNF